MAKAKRSKVYGKICLNINHKSDPYFLRGHQAIHPVKLLQQIVAYNTRVLCRKKWEKRKDKNKIRSGICKKGNPVKNEKPSIFKLYDLLHQRKNIQWIIVVIFDNSNSKINIDRHLVCTYWREEVMAILLALHGHVPHDGHAGGREEDHKGKKLWRMMKYFQSLKLLILWKNNWLKKWNTLVPKLGH